ncbi:MAG: hypothetical protein ACYDCO_13985 [Armatimonadota bacterium]
MAAVPKTLDEHRAYLHDIVRLMLWFAWRRLREHPEEPFETVLHERVDIYRKLDLNPGGVNPATMNWDDPRWLALEAEARQAYLTHREDESSSAFEEEGLEIFRPQLDARAPRDFACRSGLEGYDYGSIRFDPPREERPKRVFIHIANAIAPRSIFEDPAYLPGCLREVMRRAEESCGAEELQTSTWLNSVPGWLALFPREWQEYLSPLIQDILWHYGFWGQFITARGTFHEKRARQFRETGSMPYLPRVSWCTFTALRAHLK